MSLTQNKSDNDIATLFALLIALSNAFFGSPRPKDNPLKILFRY